MIELLTALSLYCHNSFHDSEKCNNFMVDCIYREYKDSFSIQLPESYFKCVSDYRKGTK